MPSICELPQGSAPGKYGPHPVQTIASIYELLGYHRVAPLVSTYTSTARCSWWHPSTPFRFPTACTCGVAVKSAKEVVDKARPLRGVGAHCEFNPGSGFSI